MSKRGENSSRGAGHAMKAKTPNYPYRISDSQDRVQAATVDKASDPLLDSIKHLVEKQNRLIAYERIEKEIRTKELRHQNENLRSQLRALNGDADEEYDGLGSDDLSTLNANELTNLDKSNSGMTRENLQQLLRQLQDIHSVRSVNLSNNCLNDESAEELAQLVTLDRSGAKSPRAEVGFAGIDLSFNDLGPIAAEKVFKYGILHKYLHYCNLEGNIDIAVEPGMGTFMADIIKSAASGQIGKSARTRRVKKGGSKASAGASSTAVKERQQRKLMSVRITLFDFKLNIADQNAVLTLTTKKSKKTSGSRLSERRGSKKGSKGASVSGHPMNALSFVKSILVGSQQSGPSRGGDKKRSARAPVRRPQRGAGGRNGDRPGNISGVLTELFGLITDETAEVFQSAIPLTMEGKALDAQIPSSTKKDIKSHETSSDDMRDTLMCHAVRYGKIKHVEVLLSLNASPVAPNGLGNSPLNIAKFLGRNEIYALLHKAAMSHNPNTASLLEPDRQVTVTPPPIQELGLVHAKLSRETILHLSQNMSGLTSLDISGAFVGAYGAQCLANSLSWKPYTLLSLNVSQNSIGCAGAECFSEMLTLNDTLTNLDLSSNDIADKGAKLITRVLNQNSGACSICLIFGKSRIFVVIVHAAFAARRLPFDANTCMNTFPLALVRPFSSAAPFSDLPPRQK